MVYLEAEYIQTAVSPHQEKPSIVLPIAGDKMKAEKFVATWKNKLYLLGNHNF